MPFKPEPQQPDFSSLITSLDNSKIQQNNYALYQTIFLLIQAVTRSRDLLVKKIDDLEEEIVVPESQSISNSPMLMPLDFECDCDCMPFISTTLVP